LPHPSAAIIFAFLRKSIQSSLILNCNVCVPAGTSRACCTVRIRSHLDHYQMMINHVTSRLIPHWARLPSIPMWRHAYTTAWCCLD